MHIAIFFNGQPFNLLVLSFWFGVFSGFGMIISFFIISGLTSWFIGRMAR